jgi:hypothetical protein
MRTFLSTLRLSNLTTGNGQVTVDRPYNTGTAQRVCAMSADALS